CSSLLAADIRIEVAPRHLELWVEQDRCACPSRQVLERQIEPTIPKVNVGFLLSAVGLRLAGNEEYGVLCFHPQIGHLGQESNRILKRDGVVEPSCYRRLRAVADPALEHNRRAGQIGKLVEGLSERRFVEAGSHGFGEQSLRMRSRICSD